jgi:hypothetical protein
MTELCEMQGCKQLAVGWIEAQWSVADFVRYEACFAHIDEMYSDLSWARVDGQLPLELSGAFYGPER